MWKYSHFVDIVMIVSVEFNVIKYVFLQSSVVPATRSTVLVMFVRFWSCHNSSMSIRTSSAKKQYKPCTRITDKCESSEPFMLLCCFPYPILIIFHFFFFYRLYPLLSFASFVFLGHGASLIAMFIYDYLLFSIQRKIYKFRRVQFTCDTISLLGMARKYKS